MKDLVFLYHSNCFDGFGAAWVAHRLYPDATFLPVYHGGPIPRQEMVDKHVVIMDFSYSHNIIQELGLMARSLLVLDHHKTAQEELDHLIYAPKWTTYLDDVRDLSSGMHNPPCAVFDMERSGMGIAWDYFTDFDERPWIVDYVEDRDLWRFQYGDNTRYFQAALSSFPFDFEAWDLIYEHANHLDMIKIGAGIDRKHWQDVRSIHHVCARMMTIGGYEVHVCNAPMTVTSDLGNMMVANSDKPFAACYWDTPDGRVFSLRSDKDGGNFDVSEVAKSYGGGGHRNAAGFQVAFSNLAELELL